MGDIRYAVKQVRAAVLTLAGTDPLPERLPRSTTLRAMDDTELAAAASDLVDLAFAAALAASS